MKTIAICNLVFTFLFFGFTPTEQAAASDPPPNIVFILADDLGIMDVGAYATHLSETKPSELYYETPNIDALVRKGISFSQSYANQLCSPTRAAILSGRIASTIGVTTATPRTRTYYNQGLKTPAGYSPHDAFGHKDAIPGSLAWGNGHSNTAVSPEIPTIPTVLSTHDCAYVGKWHLGGHGAFGQQPRDHGFQEIAYFDAGGSPYFNWKKAWDNKKPFYKTMPQSELAIGTSGRSTDHEYLTDDLTAQANAYIRERSKNPEKPFFLYFAQFSVHTPLQAKKETVKHFDSKSQKGVNGQNHATYAAMVKHLDESVGAILKTLEETGMAENTIVVFSSDNGGVEYTNPAATDNFPFKGGKACLYEGGVRVPTVFYQPGKFDQGTWCDVPINCVDFLSTFAELTGNTMPAEGDGESLVSILKNPTAETAPRTFYWHYPFNVIVKHPDNGFTLTPHSAIRVGDHKLIFDWQGRLELYDIPNDPFEQNDLAAVNPAHAQELFTQLKVWLRANVKEHYLPVLNEDYKPEADGRPKFINLWNE